MIVTGKAPLAVGVPASSPVADSATPAGSAPALTENVYGAVPPDAVTAWLYTLPTVPAGSSVGARPIVGALSSSTMVPVAVPDEDTDEDDTSVSETVSSDSSTASAIGYIRISMVSTPAAKDVGPDWL